MDLTGWLITALFVSATGTGTYELKSAIFGCILAPPVVSTISVNSREKRETGKESRLAVSEEKGEEQINDEENKEDAIKRLKVKKAIEKHILFVKERHRVIENIENQWKDVEKKIMEESKEEKRRQEFDRAVDEWIRRIE